MQDMTTTISKVDPNKNKLFVTQKVPINDAVSASQSTTGLCSDFIFFLTDSPDTGVELFSTTELIID